MAKKRNNGCAEVIAFLEANCEDSYKMLDVMYEKICYLINNARDNDGEAQYWIARAFLGNLGVSSDYNRAFVTAQKSVNAGYPKGYHILGQCYRGGKGCLKDKEKAKDCFRKGMELGDPDCTDALKSMERNGKILAGGAFIGTALLKIGEALANSGALDPEGFDNDNDYGGYDDYE